jgi:chromosome partitioning protein
VSKIIAIANQKGGVGKTTTTINLTTALAMNGCKTLVVDIDPQSNSTSGFGMKNDEDDNTIYRLLVGNRTAADCIQGTDIEKLFIIRSNIDLVGIEIEIVGMEQREFLLKSKLDLIKADFDFIFIDCPPSLSLITLNALVASDSVLIPVQCEYYALEGLTLLLNTIKMIKTKLKPSLEIEGYLLTMFDTRLRLSNQVAAEMQKFFKDKVYNTRIMRNVKIGESPSFGKPVVLYDPFSIGAKNYNDLAIEFLSKNGIEVKKQFDNILNYVPPDYTNDGKSSPETITENKLNDNNINKIK